MPAYTRIQLLHCRFHCSVLINSLCLNSDCSFVSEFVEEGGRGPGVLPESGREDQHHPREVTGTGGREWVVGVLIEEERESEGGRVMVYVMNEGRVRWNVAAG